MKKLLSVLLQASLALGAAISTACTGTQTAGNSNQTNGNSNAPQPSTTNTQAKAEQAGTGSIDVKSTPPGARVVLISLDEVGAEPQQKGLTPTTLTGIPVGKYTVHLERPGYKYYQKNIAVRENKTTQLSAPLRKE
jgi:hypothetical protein